MNQLYRIAIGFNGISFEKFSQQMQMRIDGEQ